jgi:general secretion pathway protein C
MNSWITGVTAAIVGASSGAPAAVLVRSETQSRSSLPGSLTRTVLADPGAESLCEIVDPEWGVPTIYKVGQRYRGARIYRIEKSRVLFVNHGVNEYLELSEPLRPPPAPVSPAGVKQVSKDQYVMARSALRDLPQLSTHARVVPSFKNGTPAGVKLFSIAPDSLYARLGVQNGDVLRSINGHETKTPDQALEIYQTLRDATRIELELERRGEILTKTYSIE